MTRAYFLAAATVACLIGLSWLANGYLGDPDRLPMQWGIDGRPNWSAPKWIALGFGPGIGVFAMATMLVRCRHDPDGRRAFRTLLPMSAILIGGHVFYLSMLWTKGIAQPG